MLTTAPASNLRNDANAIAIEHGDAYHFLGHWRHPRDGAGFPTLWSIVVNTRAKAAGFFTRRATVLADSRLSDAAKKDDEKQIALDTLQGLGIEQRDLSRAVAGHDVERQRLAQVQPADATQMMLDIEIARHFRSLIAADRDSAIAAMVDGREPRMIDAVLRLPTCLFGLTGEMVGVITSNAIARKAPDEAQHLRQLHEAAQTTQHVISRAVELITNNSALSLRERMVSLGQDAWQSHVRDGSPAALGALATKYGVTAA